MGKIISCFLAGNGGDKMEPNIIGERLKLLMKKQNLTIENLADLMHIKKEALHKKLEGEEEFYIEEMGKIVEIFNLSIKECDELFFK